MEVENSRKWRTPKNPPCPLHPWLKEKIGHTLLKHRSSIGIFLGRRAGARTVGVVLDREAGVKDLIGTLEATRLSSYSLLEQEATS